MAFLVYYMLYKRHSGVRKKLGVKTPFQAVEKPVVSKAEPGYGEQSRTRVYVKT